MANTTIYNLPALNTVDSTSLFPLSSNVTATPTTYKASIGNIGNAITGNLRMAGDNLTSTNNTINVSANSYVWNFGSTGNLTFPTGNLVITPVDAYLGNSAVIASQYHNLITLSTGANGGLSSLWVEDYANASTSNIAAVYANPTPESGIVRIAVGQNGSPGPNLWDFNANGILAVPGNINSSGDSSAAPSLNDFFSVTSAANFAIVTDNANTDKTWTFGSNGNITLPTGTPSINYANGSPYGGSGNANTGNVTFNDINVIGTGNLHLQPDPANASAYLDVYLTTGPDIHIAGNGESVILGTDAFANVTVNVDGNVSIQANAGTPYTWTFGTAGNLTAPGDIIMNSGTDGNIDSTGNVNITSNANTWTFGTSSNLTLPDGGIISESASPSGTGNTIRLKPSGGSNVNQVLVIYPTAADGDHLHLTSGGGNTELYLGSDDLFVKLSNTGNVVINSNDSSGNTAQWTFSTKSVVINPVIVFANLPAATTPGLKAFISDANLAPIGNFGVVISGGGSNYVPVFSNGANWCIG